jgi:putative Ca2+/H+ antiporter (TMEM165/GDT1 family)
MFSAFTVSLVAVILAEMGDKTQLLAMAFATRYRWQTVLWAVFWATLANHLLAVVAGNVVTEFVPMVWIKFVAALAFIAFALWTIRGDHLDGEDQKTGRSPFWTVAIAFFIAEMGDKTQLMTMTIAADEAVKIGGTGFLAKLAQIVPVWAGSTSGMIVADAFGIIVGIVLHRHIPEKTVKWAAALGFAAFGFIGLHNALDLLNAANPRLHHIVLLTAIPVVIALMWLVGRASARKGERPAGA